VRVVALQASAGGPYAIQEGQSVLLDASQSIGNPTTYSWDVNGDGVFGDVVTANPTVPLSWAQLVALGIDEGTIANVRLRISNGSASADSRATSLTVSEAALTAAGVSGIAAVEGQGLSNVVVATFSDPGADGTAGDYGATVIWDDGNGASHTSAGRVQ